MSVASVLSKVQYSGNDSDVTPYPTVFPFLDNAHIRVQIQTSSGVITELTQGADFTVDGAGDPTGGHVVTTVPVNLFDKITIFREVPLQQALDLVYNDRLPSAQLERALDLLTMAIQQGGAGSRMGWPLRFPVTENTQLTNTVLPSFSVRADRYFKFDFEGNPYMATLAEVAQEVATAYDPDLGLFITRDGDQTINGNNTFAGNNLYTGANSYTGTFNATNFSAGSATITGVLNVAGRMVVGGFSQAAITLLGGSSDPATIAWNADTSNVAVVTLGANKTLGTPTNVRTGIYYLRVKQDGTGNRTLAYSAAYKFPAGAAPVLSTGANAIDILTFFNPGDGNLYLTAQKAFA